MGCGALSKRTHSKVADTPDLGCQDSEVVVPAGSILTAAKDHDTAEPDPGPSGRSSLGGLADMIRRPSHASVNSGAHYAKTDPDPEEDRVQADEDNANRRDVHMDFDDARQGAASGRSSQAQTSSGDRNTPSIERTPSKASARSQGSHQGVGAQVARPQSQAGASSPYPGGQPEQLAALSDAESQDAIAELLGKAVLHSGSLVQHSMRVRALQAYETLAEAYQGLPKPDEQMPNFDMKVDPENLLLQLPHGMFKPEWTSLQRVSFMGTKWIALRLCNTSRAQCLKFCICAAALNNIGKNTSRSVVVEACDTPPSNSEETAIPGFVCSPIPTRESTGVSWIDVWDDISELADIIINDLCLPDKKVQAELKKWASQRDERSQGSRTRLNFWNNPNAPAVSPRFSRRSQSDAGLSGPYSVPEYASRRRRSSSEPDITQINQAAEMVRNQQEPKSGFSAMARWVRDQFRLTGVFSSLEDQLASLTPAPSHSDGRGRARSPKGREVRGQSQSRSPSRSSSRSRPRRPSLDGRERSGSQGSIHSAGSGDRVADRHLQNVAPAEHPESSDEVTDSDSPGGLPKEAVRRRKSFSTNFAVMPVLLEGEDGDDKAEGSVDASAQQSAGFRRRSSPPDSS